MNEWISIKDKLPDGTRKVLAAYLTWEHGELVYRVQICSFKTSGMWAGHFDTGFWGSAFKPTTEIPRKSLAGNVTHWMPIPEPPKGVPCAVR